MTSYHWLAMLLLLAPLLAACASRKHNPPNSIPVITTPAQRNAAERLIASGLVQDVIRTQNLPMPIWHTVNDLKLDQAAAQFLEKNLLDSNASSASFNNAPRHIILRNHFFDSPPSYQAYVFCHETFHAQIEQEPPWQQYFEQRSKIFNRLTIETSTEYPDEVWKLLAVPLEAEVDRRTDPLFSETSRQTIIARQQECLAKLSEFAATRGSGNQTNVVPLVLDLLPQAHRYRHLANNPKTDRELSQQSTETSERIMKFIYDMSGNTLVEAGLTEQMEELLEIEDPLIYLDKAEVFLRSLLAAHPLTN